MKMLLRTVILCSCIFLVSCEGNEKKLSPEQVEKIEQSISDQIRAVLRHYQQDDPIGLPGAPIPDPMDIPDMKQSFSMATMTFKKVKVYGLSKFRIDNVRSDLAALEVSVAVLIDRLDIKGDYTLSAFFSRSKGGFDVTLLDVFVEGLVMLTVQRNGQLQAQDINMDITFSDIQMEFQNLGFMGSIFQGIINSVGTFLFDSVKPFILKEVNQNIRTDINKNVEKIPNRFPNSISPFDMAVVDARKYVQDKQYDPYHVPDYNYTTAFFNIHLTHAWLTGLSTFYRVGNVTIIMENNIVYASAHVGTQVLTGKCHWEISFGGLITRAGTSSFTVDYIHVLAIVSQPLNTKRKPKLENLDLKLGNIQARVDGMGTLDYIVEFTVNVLPNLLRYQIVNAIEGPLIARAQKILDEVNVEELIEEKLPEIEEMVKSSS